MPGTLTLKPLTASLTRDTELFGTMDPYCKITLGNQKLTGQVCKNGGKHPTWEDTIVLRRADELICQVEVKEKDWLLPDTLIGVCHVNLKDIECEKRMLKWFPMSFESKPVGKLLLEVTYEPDNTFVKDALPTNVLKERINQNQDVKPEEPKKGFIQGLIHGWTPFGSKTQEAPSESKQEIQAPPPQVQNIQSANQPLPHSYDQNTYVQQDQVYQAQNWAPPSSHIQEQNNYQQKYPQFNPQEYPNAGLNYQNAYNPDSNYVHPNSGDHQLAKSEVVDYRNNQVNEVANAGEYLDSYYTHNNPYRNDQDQYINKVDPMNIIRGL